MLNVDAVAQLWDRVRTSLWFVPGLIALGAIAMAALTPSLDRMLPDELLRNLPLVFSGRPASARIVLSTIAAAMVTIAGVVFSMTLVSLQLASSQFGPRLLRTFLRDRSNQIVLGVFVGTFLYCILILSGVEASDPAEAAPRLAVTIAIALAVLGLGLLVYFIDHVAQSIHADAVVHSVGLELDSVIDELFPEPLGEDTSEPSRDDDAPEPTGAAAVLGARCDGYLRFVNGDTMIEIASEHDLVVRLDTPPGRYVIRGDRLATIWPGGALDDDLLACMRDACMIGPHRTALQDVAFVFDQLTEMALRALSPGINDPTTAVHCLDRIGSGLARIVTRPRPSPFRRGKDDRVRLIARPIALAELLDGTVDQIERHGRDNLVVCVRLLEVLGSIMERATRPDDARLLRERACLLAEEAARVHERPNERERIDAAAAWTRSS